MRQHSASTWCGWTRYFPPHFQPMSQHHQSYCEACFVAYFSSTSAMKMVFESPETALANFTEGRISNLRIKWQRASCLWSDGRCSFCFLEEPLRLMLHNWVLERLLTTHVVYKRGASHTPSRPEIISNPVHLLHLYLHSVRLYSFSTEKSSENLCIYHVLVRF